MREGIVGGVKLPTLPLFGRELVAALSLSLAAAALPANVPAESVSSGAAARLELPATDDGLPGACPVRRYDWFRKLWLERRQSFSASAEADRGAVVFLGDSITQGWKDQLPASFPGLKVANRGIGGDTTRGLLIRLDGDVLATSPRGIVLLIGTNDLEERAEPEMIAANVRLLLAALQSHDATMPVVLCAVLPSADAKRRPAAKIRALNKIYQAFPREFANVTYIDTWTLFANPQGDAKAEEFPDLLHPNEAGYAKFAAGLRPLLATLGWGDTAPDDFQPEPGFTSLFNGRDLTGWGFRPTTEEDIASAKRWRASDPEAADWPVVTEAVSFDGRTASNDGRFVAINGRLVVTVPPEGRRIQKLWTTREFPRDFILKLEFRATPNTDSGIYVRGPQLQCRDYLLAGPYRQLQHYRPQEWNEIVITVKDGVAHCTCNGEVLEAAMKIPATGPIGVEGDRGQMEYRRIRLRELPAGE